MSRSEGPDGPIGFVVVDKPPGWTSHDVVAKCRGILGTRKVGHSGTLDPMATGVLVLGVGRATKLLAFLSGLTKAYTAEVRFGQETDSLDADGAVTVTHPMAPPTLAEVCAAALDLTGEQLQVPPMVSAKKVDGRRLHELARAGTVVERTPVPIVVGRFDVEATADPMVFRARVDCSAGTYVRVLAADLGHAVGGGAHLVGLRRTAVGPFTLDDAVSLAELQELGDRCIIPPTGITRVLDSVEIDEQTAIDVGHGRVLERSQVGVADDDAGPWALLGGPLGPLLAVYQAHRATTVKPAFVMI